MRPAYLVLISSFVCLFALPLAGQQPPKSHGLALTTTQPSPTDLKARHCFHEIVANQEIRVIRIEAAPHESTELHSHRHDFVVLSLGKSSFEVSGDSLSYPMNMEDGEMQVLKGGGWSHRVINRGETPLRLLELEVQGSIHPEHPICGLGGRECVDGRFGTNEEGRFTLSTLFETETIKMARIELGPGGVSPSTKYLDHVLVALDDAQLRDDGAESGKDLHLSGGDAVWYGSSTVHRLKNLNSRDVRLLTLELKR